MNMHLAITTGQTTFTATELRKTFFQHLDRAVQGEPVRFSYKGSELQLALVPGSISGSKMARLVHREGLLSDDLDVTKELLPGWEAKWAADAERDFADLDLPDTGVSE